MDLKALNNFRDHRIQAVQQEHIVFSVKYRFQRAFKEVVICMLVGESLF